MSGERRRVTRERIFDGALEILDSGAYADLTVDALARSLRMSKSTLYKHFVSKEAVIVGLIDQVCDRVDGALEALDLAEPLDALRGFGAIFALLADDLPRAAVVEWDRLPSACRIRLQVTYSHLARTVRHVLERGVVAGDFSVADPALAAIAFSASARAGIEAAARGELGEQPSDAVHGILSLFERALLAR